MNPDGNRAAIPENMKYIVKTCVYVFLEPKGYPFGLFRPRKDPDSFNFGRFWRQGRRLMSGGSASLSRSPTKQEHYHAFLCPDRQDKNNEYTLFVA